MPQKNYAGSSLKALHGMAPFAGEIAADKIVLNDEVRQQHDHLRVEQ